MLQPLICSCAAAPPIALSVMNAARTKHADAESGVIRVLLLGFDRSTLPEGRRLAQA
jgi:hypothetical protein